MREASLIRKPSTDQGILGVWYVGTEQFCWSLEPPNRDNLPNYSCIPAGVYKCVWHRSPKYGWVYLVTGVPGRSHILIHPGNLAGDRHKGFKTHSHGCILLGKFYGQLKGQLAVLSSRPTVRLFNEAMATEPFNLTVEDYSDVRLAA